MKRKRAEESDISALAAATASAPSTPKKKDKKVKKALKKFASSLVIQASDENWEEHELAKLLSLVITQLQLSASKLEKFLSTIDCITPMILNGLNDCGHKISSHRMLHMLYNSSHGIAHFQTKISEALDQALFNVSDENFVDELNILLQNVYGVHTRADIIHIARDLCSHCDTYKAVGGLLHSLTSHLLPQEAINFIADVMSFEFVYELKGKLKHFYAQFPDVGHLLADKLALMTNNEGKVIESDEDENGDLMDFVCDDDELSFDTDASERYSSEASASEDVSSESEVDIKSKRSNGGSKKKRRVIDDESD